MMSLVCNVAMFIGGWLLAECNGSVVNSGMGNLMFCKVYLDSFVSFIMAN